jgi:D-glycero-D-manno-heptose 1,7-bisphosphate phosphatase
VGIGAKVLKRAVFLDRDGVLNEAIERNGGPLPPASLAELRLVDGVADELSRLERVVPLMFVITNQPDVARGTQTREVVEEMNAALAACLPITKFYTCYHDDSDECTCRKPRPGSLYAASKEYDVDLCASFMVGDRWRDIDAGASAGCTTILLKKNYDERKPSARPDLVVDSLHDAVDAILARISDYALPPRSSGVLP